MVKDWLTKKVTVQEAEASHTPKPDKDNPNPVPFGHINDRWKELLAEMQPDDELWEFRSPPETWQHLAGRAGFAVIRKGEVVAVLTTMMN